MRQREHLRAVFILMTSGLTHGGEHCNGGKFPACGGCKRAMRPKKLSAQTDNGTHGHGLHQAGDLTIPIVTTNECDECIRLIECEGRKEWKPTLGMDKHAGQALAAEKVPNDLHEMIHENIVLMLCLVP